MERQRRASAQVRGWVGLAVAAIVVLGAAWSLAQGEPDNSGLSGEAFAIPTFQPVSDNAPCPQALIEGTLVAHDRWGRETDPEATVVAVSFPFPDTIDATLSNGLHVTSTLEPEASDN